MKKHAVVTSFCWRIFGTLLVVSREQGWRVVAPWGSLGSLGSPLGAATSGDKLSGRPQCLQRRQAAPFVLWRAGAPRSEYRIPIGLAIRRWPHTHNTTRASRRPDGSLTTLWVSLYCLGEIPNRVSTHTGGTDAHSLELVSSLEAKFGTSGL